LNCHCFGLRNPQPEKNHACVTPFFKALIAYWLRRSFQQKSALSQKTNPVEAWGSFDRIVTQSC
jgi:hypothetical protein